MTRNLDHNERVWDQLAQHGAPLSCKQDPTGKPTEASLAETMILASQDLKAHPNQDDKARKIEALEALVLALSLHYPSYYNGLIQRSKQITSWLPQDITGRHIKLKRIASAILATYL